MMEIEFNRVVMIYLMCFFWYE